MKILLAIIVILAVLLSLAAVIAIAMILKSSIDTDRLLQTVNRPRSFVRSLLRVGLGRYPVIAPVYLPSLDAPGRIVRIDAITVTRGGVTVVKSVPEPGHYVNLPYSNWQLHTGGSAMMILSPFALNNEAWRAVTALLTSNGYTVPVHNLVVLSAYDVSFANYEELLVTADELIPCIRSLDRSRSLSLRRMWEIRKFIRQNRINPRRIQRSAEQQMYAQGQMQAGRNYRNPNQ